MSDSREHQQYDDEPHREEREAFTKLLAANPNYFGTLEDSDFEVVLPIQGSTFYEEISCVAFNPELDILEATVQIKQEFGYGGDRCSQGTPQYVRFYVDYGAGWQDVGVSSFTAHDIPDAEDCEGAPEKPLSYVVQHPLDPERERCEKPVLPMVRAILSWNALPPPGMPNWPQVWGNTVDRMIQIKPRRRPQLPELPEFVGTVGLDPGALLSIADLTKLYGPEKEGVEPARFAHPDVKQALGPGLSPQLIAAKAKEYAELGLDWSELVADQDESDGDTRYEELTCLGLDTNTDWLIAGFVVKLPNGYGGDLCETGSLEHVAFWADFPDQCDWRYLGTASLRVHDIKEITRDGIHYWVGLKVDLEEFRGACEDLTIGRVRAVLSWSTPPSKTDPYAPVRWGNAMERHVEITPRREDVGLLIDVIGGISVSQIETGTTGQTVPNAVFAQWGSPADPHVPSRQCPFGGNVFVNAYAPGRAAAGEQYRLSYRASPTLTNPTPSEIPITTSFWVSNGLTGFWHSPDPVTGWTAYLDPAQNVYNVLGNWKAGGLASGKHELKLDLANSGGTVIATTGWLAVDIDNEVPTATIAIDPALGGACTDITQGTGVTGTFVARDPNFGRFTLDTTPDSQSPPDPTPPSGTSQTPVAGSGWSLATGGMPVCGYVVTVRVWDRTIRHSTPNIHNFNKDDVGFCLRAP